MIFAKLLTLVVSAAIAASASFNVVGSSENDNIADLKLRAVSEYLQAFLGNRYEQYESQINAEFAERYVQDYKVNRAGGKIQITGHLDSDGLKGWIRLSETKRGANNVKPVFLLSSSIPGLTIGPAQTAAKTRESGMGQIFLAEASGALQKLNTKLGVGGTSLGLNQPPRNDGELKQLQSASGSDGFNCALWLHLVPCKSCGGARLDTHFYNLNPARQVLARSDELPLAASDFASSPRLKQALKGPMAALKNDLEEKVANGALFSNAYRLTIEGLSNYRAFKVVQTAMQDVDFIIQATLKRSEPKVAEYEVLSALSADELASRLDGEQFDGFRLKTVNVDAPYLIVRFGK